MERQADVQDEDTKRFAHSWRQEVDIADKYGSYQTRILDMFSEFQHIWNGCLGRINTAKHPIKLLKLSTRPVHSAPYRVGPNTCEFEKANINKMLIENIFNPG